MGQPAERTAKTSAKKPSHKMKKILKGAALVAAAYGAKKVYDIARAEQADDKAKASSKGRS